MVKVVITYVLVIKSSHLANVFSSSHISKSSLDFMFFKRAICKWTHCSAFNASSQKILHPLPKIYFDTGNNTIIPQKIVANIFIDIRVACFSSTIGKMERHEKL